MATSGKRRYILPVAPPLPTCIWRKAVGAAWLAANDSALDLRTAGTYALIERPGSQRTIVEACCNPATAEELRRSFGGTVSELPPNWQAQAFATAKTKPLRIGKRLLVASDPADVGPAYTGALLLIPAGAAFGTGEHATTAMSLRMLERITRRLGPGWSMLDAGTGSGILALAGRCFGAAKVDAIDNDPLAVSTAKANARRNNIRNVRFTVADVTRPQPGKFDIISANLYSELLAITLPLWRWNLKPGGRLIVSGVMRTQERDLLRALRKSGYSAEEIRRRGKWIALLSRPVS